MNLLYKIRYAFRLIFSSNESLSFYVTGEGEQLKLEVMSSIRNEETLMIIAPYLQGIVYESMGITENWDVN